MAAIPSWLLADIIENPADNTPRLVLVGWMEDNDDLDRAELIWLQCGFEDDHYANLTAEARAARIAELEACNRERWLREDGIPEDLRAHVFFARGVPSTYITLENFRICDPDVLNRDLRAGGAQTNEERARAAELLEALEGKVVPAPLTPLQVGEAPLYLEVPALAAGQEIVVGRGGFIPQIPSLCIEAIVTAPNSKGKITVNQAHVRFMNTGAGQKGNIGVGDSTVGVLNIGARQEGDISVSSAAVGALTIGPGKKGNVPIQFEATVAKSLSLPLDMDGDLYVSWGSTLGALRFYNPATGEDYPIDLENRETARQQILELAEKGKLPHLKDFHIGIRGRDINRDIYITEGPLNVARASGAAARLAAALTDTGAGTPTLDSLPGQIPGPGNGLK